MNKSSKLTKAVKRRAQLYRCRKAEQGIWLTGHMEEILIIKLTDEHLGNILAMYDDHRSPFDFPGVSERMATPLVKEALRRGIVVEESKDRFKLIELE